MKRLFILLTSVLLAGCSASNEIAWSSAFDSVTCTPEQWDKAYKEAKQSVEIDSRKDGQRYAYYWLGVSMARNCTPKKYPTLKD